MKDFLVIGNKNALFWKDIFPIYMQGDVRFGYNSISWFILPEEADRWNRKQGCFKLADLESTGRWITNLKVDKKNEPLELEAYNPEKHLKYDTYDAVNTDSIKHIPDYGGTIGVPVGIVDYINTEQFKIIGKLMTGGGEYDYGKPVVQGKEKYVRILIKKI